MATSSSLRARADPMRLSIKNPWTDIFPLIGQGFLFWAVGKHNCITIRNENMESTRITFTTRSSLKDAVDKLASRCGQSRSETVSRLLSHVLDSMDRPSAMSPVTVDKAGLMNSIKM
jgi:hypothetical protein